MNDAVDNTWTECAIAMGSNLGDREGRLRGAVEAIASTPGVRNVRVSSFHETEPVGPITQGLFINAAAIIETTLSARALLERLHEIERTHGRERSDGQRWGPRTLDLDLLLYADAKINEPGLTVPHPRMHERRFVLAPLAELVPSWPVPHKGQTIGGLLASLDA